MTIGADKAYDISAFVADSCAAGVTSDVAQNIRRSVAKNRWADNTARWLPAEPDGALAD